jgi:hypothetical protein
MYDERKSRAATETVGGSTEERTIRSPEVKK